VLFLAIFQFTVNKGREKERGKEERKHTHKHKNKHTNNTMFDGVSDQFHQFIASRTTLPLPPPLSFPLHASSSPNNFPPYDIPYNPSHQVPLPPNLLHPLHHQSPTTLKHEEKAENNLAIPDPILDPSWTNEEVLALLRIRSSMENWFPEFTWEHVSRYTHTYHITLFFFFFPKASSIYIHIYELS
jgi:hypothetical protein